LRASGWVSSSQATLEPNQKKWLVHPVRSLMRLSYPAARQRATIGSLCCDIHRIAGYTGCPVLRRQAIAVSRMLVSPTATTVPPWAPTQSKAALVTRMVASARPSGSSSTQPGFGNSRATSSLAQT
jgi:hypothetical protein